MTKDSEIEQRYRDQMNVLARLLDKYFNDDINNKRTGFFLMVFPFEGFDGRANYISNADRRTIITLLKEMAARFEGQPELKGTA